MNTNPDISAKTHRWGVALLPFVVGVATVLIKATTDMAFDVVTVWLLANAAVTGLLTVYVNWVRGTSPQ